MQAMSKSRKAVYLGLSYFFYVMIALVFILPVLYMFVSSFKSDVQIENDMSSLKAFFPVGRLTLENYRASFVEKHFGKFFLNSSVVSLIVVCCATIVNAMMGYALGMLEFKGRKFLISVVIAFSIIPSEAVIINRFLVALKLGLINSYWGLAAPMIGHTMYIFLYYNHFRGMPKELQEAAVVDGETYAGIFWKIMIPLSKPILATVAIMAFIGAWGDLLWPALVTRDETFRTLPLALRGLDTDVHTFWGQIFTFATLMTLPVFAVFLAFQKQFIASLAMTGIKG